jgi:UDP-N-acetylmuramate dehydrogenase
MGRLGRRDDRAARTDPAVEDAAARLGPLAVRDAPLGARTTYRLGGRAALLVFVNDEGDLGTVVDAVAESGVGVLVLGRGSNLLVAEAGFPGLCVALGRGFEAVATGDDAVVTAGGAVAYPALARTTAAAGLTGMEWAVGIPGSVGGAVRMNAGGHGSQTIDRLVAARIVDLRGRTDRTARAGDLALSYRRSGVRPDEIVVSASFALGAGDAAESAATIAEIVAWRRANQPAGRNAGSVFQNPPGDSAGRLIELAGLKGLRIGKAHVARRHANFIQADPGASADDVYRLLCEVRRLVAERCRVELQVELCLVGFGP